MSDSSTIFVVLPAYNERENLPSLFARFDKVLTKIGRAARIIVVDDGGTDGQAEWLAKQKGRVGPFPLQVVTHAKNMGLGQTLLDGLLAAVSQAKPGDLVLTMDADNTHPPELLLSMLGAMGGNSADIVIASRYRTGATITGLSRFRKLTSLGARLLFQVVFPIRGVRDYTCGYRLYDAHFLQRALYALGNDLVRERGFACMAELLLKLARCGARCTEVPLELRYDKKSGESKMRIRQTVGRTLRLLLGERLAPLPARTKTRLAKWDGQAPAD